MLGAAAWFAAASLRLESLVSTLLAAYIFLVGAMAGSTIGLSPFRAVHQRPLGAVAVLLLIGSVAVWLRRGRPSPPLAPAAAALRTVLRSPIAVGFLAVLVLALGYELFLALTVPPNNWDSLQYHLPRVAAWAQHGGIYWIANPPTDILNTRQPVAEQEILFLFVAFGRLGSSRCRSIWPSSPACSPCTGLRGGSASTPALRCAPPGSLRRSPWSRWNR